MKNHTLFHKCLLTLAVAVCSCSCISKKDEHAKYPYPYSEAQDTTSIDPTLSRTNEIKKHSSSHKNTTASTVLPDFDTEY